MNYTGKQKFEIEHDTCYGEMTVEIDFDAKFQLIPENPDIYSTMDVIKEQVEFWAGWQDELNEFDNDYVKCFLAMLAKEAFRVGLYNDWNAYGIVEYFNDAQTEGWCNMDGTHGVKIIYFSNLEISNDDLTIKSLPNLQR
jgi:hypothetical protein